MGATQVAIDSIQSIKIVHEADAATEELDSAVELLTAATRILFIGFGYHEANMRKLKVFEKSSDVDLSSKVILGTHRGIKSRRWQRICNRYQFSPEAKRTGAASISEFLNEHLIDDPR